MKLLILFLPLFFGAAQMDGNQFKNSGGPPTDKSLSKLIKWKLTAKRVPWPEWIEVRPKVPPRRSDNLLVTFINHATCLIQVDNVNILTDPIWSKRASPVSFAGPKRVRNPGVNFNDLPPIDVIILSHNHYDHFDLDTLSRLAKRDSPLLLMGLRNGVLVRGFTKNYKELNWGESTKVKELSIHFERSHHWSARGLFDKREMLWGSYVIKSSKGKIYFAGDTGWSDHFKHIGDKYGPFILSLLPIGHYEPRWFMKSAHINPQEAVAAHKDLKSQLSIGMHFGTFPLTDEGIDDPIKDLEIAKGQANIENFKVLNFGQTLQVSK